MDREFWLERWQLGQTHFHRLEPNPLLVEHAQLLAGRKRVYVPLAGKSLDMAYLRGAGHEVFATELSSQAIEQFFAELGEPPRVSQRGSYRVHQIANLTVLEGDALALTDDMLGGPVDAIYDRASLVALDPRTQRESLVASFERVLAPGGVLLLVVYEYDQSKCKGPPWSVGDADVRRLFEGRRITQMAERAEPASPRLAEAGVPALLERLYRIE